MKTAETMDKIREMQDAGLLNLAEKGGIIILPEDPEAEVVNTMFGDLPKTVVEIEAMHVKSGDKIKAFKSKVVADKAERLKAAQKRTEKLDAMVVEGAEGAEPVEPEKSNTGAKA